MKRRKLRTEKPPCLSHNGYPMVFVGRDHHLAAPNGYATEHRVIAEQLLGRKLISGEIVHHVDHDKRNNDPVNLEVLPSRWHHNMKHRKLLTSRQNPNQPNERILCACGCGETLWRFNSQHIEVRFISGHNARLQPKMYKFPKPRPGLHNKTKTHCPSGHPYSLENTRMKGNRRVCRTCHRRTSNG